MFCTFFRTTVRPEHHIQIGSRDWTEEHNQIATVEIWTDKAERLRRINNEFFISSRSRAKLGGEGNPLHVGIFRQHSFFINCLWLRVWHQACLLLATINS
jgi:hypothetical protein